MYISIYIYINIYQRVLFLEILNSVISKSLIINNNTVL